MDDISVALANTPFSNFKSSLLNDGYNCYVYLLTLNTEQYIAHLQKKNVDTGSSLYNSFRALSICETVGLRFIPKPIFFDQSKNLLIESFVKGDTVAINKMDKAQMDLFTEQLIQVHHISFSDVRDICTQNNLDIPSVELCTDTVRVYGIERFAIAKTLCPDQEIVSWIEKKLNANILKAKSANTQGEMGLRWGDIGNNILMNAEGINFIDWEFSNISLGHELSYIKIHNQPSEEQFDYLVTSYAIRSGISKADLYNEINFEEGITRINDVIWAAMKWGQHAEDSVLCSKYSALTKERILMAQQCAY